MQVCLSMVCFVHPVWSFQHLSMPCDGHVIARNSSQMLESHVPITSEMHICDKSASLLASWPQHSPLHPHHHFFFFFFFLGADRLFWLIFVRAIVMAWSWEEAQILLPLITISARTQIFAPATLQAAPSGWRSRSSEKGFTLHHVLWASAEGCRWSLWPTQAIRWSEKGEAVKTRLQRSQKLREWLKC